MSYASEVLADSPLVFLRTQDVSGDLTDSSGNSHTAVFQSGSPNYAQPGAVPSDANSKSVDINSATTDWWSIPYNAVFDVGDVWTIECWLKRATTGTGEQTICIRDQGFYLGLITNQLFMAKTNVAGIAKSTVTITDTVLFHHCVNTKNGASVHQYIDGIDVTGTVTNATTTNGTTPDIRIGSDAGGTAYDGNLAELAIYATELSAARVLAHYNAGIGPLGISSKASTALFPKKLLRRVAA